MLTPFSLFVVSQVRISFRFPFIIRFVGRSGFVLLFSLDFLPLSIASVSLLRMCRATVSHVSCLLLILQSREIKKNTHRLICRVEK